MIETPLKALVVEDDPVVRQLTMRALAREDFRCDAANNGAEASERLAECNYDVVVADLLMPVKHGHALASEILSQASRPGLVILTSVAEEKIANDLVARGVDGIVFKPANFIEFAANVKKVAVARQQVHRLRQAAAQSHFHEQLTHEVVDKNEAMSDFWNFSNQPRPIESKEGANQEEAPSDSSEIVKESPATAANETRSPEAGKNSFRSTYCATGKKAIENRRRDVLLPGSATKPSKSVRSQAHSAAYRKRENRRRPGSDLAPRIATPTRETANECDSEPSPLVVAVTQPVNPLHPTRSRRSKPKGELVHWMWKQVGQLGTFQAFLIVSCVGFASILAYQAFAPRQHARGIPKLEDLGARVSRDSRGNLDVDLSGRDVTDLINDLTRFRHMHALNISTSNITDNDLVSLGKLKSLRSLNLNNTDISDKGATNLLPLSRLRELQLNGTNVTISKIRELERAIPGLKVYYDRERRPKTRGNES